ncbi:hypothetical protein A2956_04960 [Candidatus Roizmanbacteria bacterium RIFCSPLOWO2_01_FULL_37_57]|nr:MAG: hypothetical protein A2956_04960 [Candidatus Roizmanbacteria bacterium RIFCSPLOWO2_01_FULL_37_57]
MEGKLKKNILITGAGGFIGQNLAENLSKRYKIYGSAHKDLELLDEEAVRGYIQKNKIKIVVHCANVGGGRDTVGRPSVIYENLRMFFNIARNLDYLERMIYFGSGAEYDKSRPLIGIKESDFDRQIPKDDYGFAKYVCSKFTENSSKIIALRLFAVFGKYENCYFKFISNSIVKNILNLPIVIAQNVYFDFLYIDDFIKIIEHFIISKARNNIYNVANGKRVDLITIANIINMIGKNKSKTIVKNLGLNMEYTANISLLKSEIPNLKFTPLKNAVAELYNWYEKNIDKIDKEKIARDEYLKFISVKKR